MHTGLRRTPVATDTPCPVCTGLISAKSETALAFDLLAPGAMPVALVYMHALCYNALSLTTADVLGCRERPRGPQVDPSGAIVHIAEGVHFRVSGVNRTAVAEAVTEAVRTFKRGGAREPIVAFVRRTVVSQVGTLILRVTETAGPPPHVRTAQDPSMIVAFETGAPNRHAAMLERFNFHPVSGVTTQHPRYITAVDEMRDFIRQRADVGGTEGAIKEEMMRLPRVVSVHPALQGGWNVAVDPNRAVPAGMGGAYTPQPPPTGSYGTPPSRPGGMSPTDTGDNLGNASGAASPGATASGGPLPPPGEVTRPMLEPLDTPESLASRGPVADSIGTGLRNAFPKAGIARVAIDRDPSTLAEVVTVTVQRRVQTESASMLAQSFTGHLRSRVASWANLEAAGLTLIVVDATPPERPDGNELADEVSLRSLPKCPVAPGTTTAIGKRVAFRVPLWLAIFDGEGKLASAHTDPALSPYKGELKRIKDRFKAIIGDVQPEWLRIGGTLTGYDAVTDHAVVSVQLPQGDIHIHTSLSWTMEWNMPLMPGIAPAGFSADGKRRVFLP